MAEPTCVMLPFSYTSPPAFPDDIHEENSAMYGIEESVSFGRFMSDNLEWEKWSSFSSNRNRYVEEAEKYSKPGSVAQKKAYFEAHFKRMAALKAAALLEQTNSAQNSHEGVTEGDGINSTEKGLQNVSINVQIEANNFKEVDKVQKVCQNEEDKGFVVHQNDLYSVGTECELNSNLRKNVDRSEPAVETLSDQNKPYLVPVKDEICNESKEIESCGTVQTDKPPLKKKSGSIEDASEPIAKKNPPLSSYMSPSVGGTGRTSVFAESTTKYSGSVYPGKENYTTPTKKKTNVTDPDKKKTPLRLSINREINRIMSPVMRKIGTSSKASKDCSTPLKTPAKGSKYATSNATLESPRMTPSRGSRSLLDSIASDNKGSGSRWHVFSSNASMSPSTSRHRISSPIIPNSICLNGDRSTRRKQKLEGKFNATATEKPPQTSKFKEKAEAELNKFRQSFCFKAMSSPDHYGENEALRSPKRKDGQTQGKSPKRGKQPAKTASKVSLPPRKPVIKQNGSKNVQQSNYSALWTKKPSG
ncbi:hypothetical protein RND81_03G090500 [Saponaria officinalis]|uniref:TPX2 C-terminal domain-containing protein n=1 Tax=Saponaria officinalis TaxID=3572 RepID=A0AAW1M6D7_SAPOF